MFEVIKAHTIAKQSYTYDQAKQAHQSLQIDKTMMFTLKHNNQYTTSESNIECGNRYYPN